MKNIALYTGIVFFLCNCKKEIGPQNVQEYAKGTGSLIVLNEGNFGFGNASVSLYNPDKKEVFNNQFKAVNGFGIGDVLQSVKRHNGNLYFVVNNSGKVVVTDTNLVYKTEITGFNSPRYMEVSEGKGFITDLKQKAVYVVDLATNQITGEIPMQGWTEQVLSVNNKIYVLDRGDYLSNVGPNFIFVINPLTNTKIDSIEVTINPNSMVVDRNKNIWVLSSGDNTGVNATIQKVNTNSNLIDLTTIFNQASDNPSRLSIDRENEILYFLNQSVFKMNISALATTIQLFHQGSTENFYGLSVIKGMIYATDAKSYNEAGDIHIFDKSGDKDWHNTFSFIPQSVN
ncbi:MAG: hypothetical protein P8N07_00500 [Flavobacteriales bacterium]|nr:hypothetical protein [Flavobacteriales bacterium]